MQQPEPTLSQLLEARELWKRRALHATNAERGLRAAIIARLFPNPKEGANHAEIEFAGIAVTADCPLPESGRGKFTLQYTIERKVDPAAFDALRKRVLADEVPELVGVNLDSLIRAKPELAVTEYRKLPEPAMLAFDSILTIKPGSPQLEFKVL